MILKGANICLFLFYIFGLGYALTSFWRSHNLETTIMRIGIGLGALPVVGVLLNLLRIPLDWRIFFALSSVIFLIKLISAGTRGHFKIHFQIKERPYVLGILLILLAFNFFIYCKGPFLSPWLEDDDSWAHAAGIKYVAIEKNFNPSSGEFHYINPYPPGYDLIFGILHQTHPSLYWTDRKSVV